MTSATTGASGSAQRVDRQSLGADAHKMRMIPARQLAIRFAFGGAISAIAGVVGEVLGEHAAGVLLAFPAILPAALTLIEQREGTSTAVSEVRGAVVGAFGLLGFALTIEFLAERVPVLSAITLAAAAWGAAAAALYFGGRALAARAGELQYLPDVAVDEAQPLIERLRRRGLRVAVAESCTGGALAALMTAVPKASEAVQGGMVAYVDEMKECLLDVSASVLERDGAVSEPAARAMADGVRERMHAELGIAITGALGAPAGGEPPGTVFICAIGPERSMLTRLEGGETPEACRAEALRAALRMGLQVLDDEARG